MVALILCATPALARHKAEGVARDGHGKIKRSRAAVAAFRKTHPCPATHKTRGACPGYVVDHVLALCRHGKDEPANLQWQSKADAKAKDKWECDRDR